MPDTLPGPLPALTPFLSEIAERAQRIEQDRRMPADLAERMAAAGLFRLLFPDLYGGLEVHPRCPYWEILPGSLS